jgi:predicted component of type VI protein secretion system
VVLWLHPDAVPRLELSSRGTTRLGRNSWLTGRPSQTRIKVDLPS